MDLQTRFSEHDWAYVVDAHTEETLPELDLDGLLAEAEEEEELELEDALESDGPAPPLRRPTGRGAEREALPIPWA